MWNLSNGLCYFCFTNIPFHTGLKALNECRHCRDYLTRDAVYVNNVGWPFFALLSGKIATAVACRQGVCTYIPCHTSARFSFSACHFSVGHKAVCRDFLTNVSRMSYVQHSKILSAVLLDYFSSLNKEGFIHTLARIFRGIPARKK